METFVVRIWAQAAARERSGVGLRRVRGIVEHVASGRSSAFRGLEELGALILLPDDWPIDPLASPLDGERADLARD